MGVALLAGADLRDLRDATTDYADGYRAGYERARLDAHHAAAKAQRESKPVLDAIYEIAPPRALREPNGLDYRGG